MAVVPPTAPTAPTVPKVELRDGGTVHIKNGSSPTLSDEQKARDSVAQGNGALSKTTVSSDKKKDSPAKTQSVSQNTPQKQQPQQNTANSEADRPKPKRESVEQTDKATASDETTATFLGGTNEGTNEQDPLPAKTHTQTAKSFAPPVANRGGSYWLTGLLVFVVLGVVILTVALNKNKRPPKPTGKRQSPAREESRPRFEARV